MTDTKQANNEKFESTNTEEAIFENNFIRKNIYYFHNACTPLKFNFISRESKTKSNWYENLEKPNKICKNRNSNLVIFGLNESREKDDVHLFFDLVSELNSLHFTLFNVCCKITCQVDENKRLNSKKNIIDPAPLLIKLGGEKSQLVRNEILKAARELKNSKKFQNVFISPDLSPYQRRRLNDLKLIRNDLNEKLNASPFTVSYYYGIRNNKIIKIKKDIDQESESTAERKIKDLSEELKLQKELLIESMAKLRSEYNSIIKSYLKVSNTNIEAIKYICELVKMLKINTKEQFLKIDEKFTYSYTVMLFILEGIDLDNLISNQIKKTLKNYVEKYKII